MTRIINILGFVLLALLLCPVTAEKTYAAIKDPDELAEAEWEYLHEASIINKKGWIQAMCVTDHYIVCFENASSKTDAPDTLIAFYKNDYDENGDPVVQYSYAKHITERDYEHGNGMTYNPNTNEIYIAAGPLLDRANYGNIYVVDAYTLEYKRTINVGNGQYNYWCLSYSAKNNQYILRGDSESGWVFFITDEDFNIIDTITDGVLMERAARQDICITGDYIISSSYNRDTKLDNYLAVYSISGRNYVGTYHTYLQGWEKKQEIESICEIEPGRFLILSGTVTPRRLRFYETKVTAIYDVVTDAENGKITESTYEAEEGTDYLVAFQPKKNYELEELTVDGKVVDSQPDQTSYTFKDVKANHKITAKFSKIPKYKITTSATHGSITGGKSVYRDKGYKVSYEPEEHYELYQIRIDGETIDTKGRETEYKFTNIQQAHHIEVEFREIPSWEIETSVTGGTISPSIKKAYRDTTEKVTYQGQENYVLLFVEVDGKKVDKTEFADSITLHDIQEGHQVRVVYIWKYMFLTIGLGSLAAVLSIGYFNLSLRRRRRRLSIKNKRQKQ